MVILALSFALAGCGRPKETDIRSKNAQNAMRAVLLYAELNDPYVIVHSRAVVTKLLPLISGKSKYEVPKGYVYPRGSLVVDREGFYSAYRLDTYDPNGPKT